MLLTFISLYFFHVCGRSCCKSVSWQSIVFAGSSRSLPVCVSYNVRHRCSQWARTHAPPVPVSANGVIGDVDGRLAAREWGRGTLDAHTLGRSIIVFSPLPSSFLLQLRQSVGPQKLSLSQMFDMAGSGYVGQNDRFSKDQVTTLHFICLHVLSHLHYYYLCADMIACVGCQFLQMANIFHVNISTTEAVVNQGRHYCPCWVETSGFCSFTPPHPSLSLLVSACQSVNKTVKVFFTLEMSKNWNITETNSRLRRNVVF